MGSCACAQRQPYYAGSDVLLPPAVSAQSGRSASTSSARRVTSLATLAASST